VLLKDLKSSYRVMQLLLRCYSLRLTHTDYDCLHTLVQVSHFPLPLTALQQMSLSSYYTKTTAKDKTSAVLKRNYTSQSVTRL